MHQFACICISATTWKPNCCRLCLGRGGEVGLCLLQFPFVFLTGRPFHTPHPLCCVTHCFPLWFLSSGTPSGVPPLPFIPPSIYFSLHLPLSPFSCTSFLHSCLPQPHVLPTQGQAVRIRQCRWVSWFLCTEAVPWSLSSKVGRGYTWSKASYLWLQTAVWGDIS